MTLLDPIVQPAGGPPTVSQVAPVQQPSPQPAPAPTPPRDIKAAAQKQAEYLMRNPEMLEAVVAELEKGGAVDVHDRISALEREVALRDALTDHGLTKEDMAFIAGTTKEEINAAAAALKARYDALKPPGGQPQPAPTPQPGQPAPPAPAVPQLPETVSSGAASLSPEQAEKNLMESATEWCKGFKTDTLGRMG